MQCPSRYRPFAYWNESPLLRCTQIGPHAVHRAQGWAWTDPEQAPQEEAVTEPLPGDAPAKETP